MHIYAQVYTNTQRAEKLLQALTEFNNEKLQEKKRKAA
jgi:hypothetical protein